MLKWSAVKMKRKVLITGPTLTSDALLYA
ncbi:hypothetical protein, partial [Acinetobacter baumannii]